MIPLLYPKKIGSGMKKVFIGLLILYTCITFFLFLPYSLHLRDHLPNSIDPVFYAWNISHNTDSLLQGGKNLLNTNIFYPESNTLAFSDTLYAQIIFTAPIIVLTKNSVLAENIYILLTFPLAGISMFLLAYYVTKHPLASSFAGLFFAFCYPRIAQIGHMPMLSSQWLPLFILYLLRFFEKRSWKNFLIMVFLYILNITSTIYFGVFLLLFIGILCTIEIVSWIRKHTWRPFAEIGKKLGVSLIPILIVFAIVLFPYIRLKAEYPTIKRHIIDAAMLSATVQDYITVLPTSLISKFSLFTKAINEKPLYPTVTVLFLAIAGVIIGWKKNRKIIVLCTTTAVAACVLSFGPYIEIVKNFHVIRTILLPYSYLYRLIPLMQAVRVPARFSIISILCLALLAAIALASLLKNKRNNLLAIPILALFLIEIWQVNTPIVSIPIFPTIPKVYEWLQNEQNDLIIVELPFQPPEKMSTSMEEQLLKTYEETKEKDRYALETYRIYFSTFHKKRLLNGYSGFFPQIYHDNAKILSDFPSDESIQMLKNTHVRYMIIHGWQYTDKNFSDIQYQISYYPELRLIKQFDEDYVYEISGE
jgi:hypothetical protein